MALVDKLMFTIVSPRTLLSDNGTQLVAHFFPRKFSVVYITNAITTAYQPERNGRVECINHSSTTMLASFFQ